MKIYSIAIETDQGRRTQQLSPPIEVEPLGGGDVPAPLRTFPDVLWHNLQMIARNSAELAAAIPKAEA